MRSANIVVWFLMVAVMVGGLSGCASSTTQSTQGEGSQDAAYAGDYDPLEGFNRAMYQFNYTVDGLVIKPATQIYRGVVPVPGRRAVSNFLSNLTSPVTLVNSVLQGDPQNAFATFWRFMLNSTLGIGGVFDFAGDVVGLKAHHEDFGQTLGVYNTKPGPYLVLPLLGPSSMRDLPGRVVDFFTDPLTYVLSDGWILARTGVSAIDARSRHFNVIEGIYRDSFDPYATIRSGYTQKRQADVENRGWPKGPAKNPE